MTMISCRHREEAKVFINGLKRGVFQEGVCGGEDGEGRVRDDNLLQSVSP